MLWFKKRKERKRDAAFFDVKNDIEMNKALGAMSICIPVDKEIREFVENWCKEQGYKMAADHITDGVTYFRFYGWN